MSKPEKHKNNKSQDSPGEIPKSWEKFLILARQVINVPRENIDRPEKVTQQKDETDSQTPPQL